MNTERSSNFEGILFNQETTLQNVHSSRSIVPDSGVLTSVDKITWPQRLLHVREMKSYERVECGRSDGKPVFRYGNVTAPPYNVLSYTWGRWAGTGTALKVENVSWSIPSIDKKHFSIEQFTKTLKIVGEKVQFVWVDIACIDQEDKMAKAAEIGKQAAIFHRAQSAFVWFNTLSAEKLLALLADIAESAKIIAEKTHNGKGRWLKAKSQSLQELFQDPWFSSLWTLQECYLRPDAIILSLSAEKVKVSGLIGNSIYLNLQQLIDTCLSVCYPPDGSLAVVSDFMHSQIKRVGFSEIKASNSMVLLSIASRRQTMETKDRIYAIMQIYGLRLGDSATPPLPSDLGSLEEQLCAALNQRSPVLAQLFVSKDSAPPGRAWQLRLGLAKPFHYYKGGIVLGLDTCPIIPRDFFNVVEIEEERRGKIFLSSGRAHYSGYAWDFENLINIWEVTQPPPRNTDLQIQFRAPDMNSVSCSIYLDICMYTVDINDMVHGDQTLYLNKPLLLGKILVARYKSRLKILILGKIRPTGSNWIKDSNSGNSDAFCGIIVIEEESNTWRRIGFCTWRDDPVDYDLFNCVLG